MYGIAVLPKVQLTLKEYLQIINKYYVYKTGIRRTLYVKGTTNNHLADTDLQSKWKYLLGYKQFFFRKIGWQELSM